MAQVMNMHTFQTRTTDDQFLLLSTKHNANLSILKKNLISTSSRSKRPSNIHISCSVGPNTTTITQPETEKLDPAKIDIRRSQFPPNFMFGAGSAAYQVEGAWNEGGKGKSIWDTFAREHPDKIKDRSNGNVAVDMYHKYKDDVQLMKEMGLDSYRFSISWPRILPNGTLKGGINKEGIMYYNNLINELIKNGITPFVTLFHWDVPQALEDSYNGFLSKEILNDFKDYCQLCFQEFGDRVKHWTTLNEPYVFTCFGYSTGKTAPGRCSGKECPQGNSLTEPYTVSHNLLLAHATAVQLYRNHYKSIQGGEIGIVLNCTWYKPYSDSLKDKDAKHRALEFMLGWYMEPLVNGEYPYIMRELVGERLPELEKEESDMIKGSFDFIGFNYYTSKYAKNIPKTWRPAKSVDDSWVEETAVNIDDVPIGDHQGAWIYMVPDGLPDLLTYTKKKYDVPKLYVTENGTMQLDDNVHELPLENAISDQDRVNYMILHLKELRDAMDREGLKVEGYFVWSLMDNYEWFSGYTNRFGLVYVDHKNNLARKLKNSAHWYTKFLHS